jgi:hypothetical protein
VITLFLRFSCPNQPCFYTLQIQVLSESDDSEEEEQKVGGDDSDEPDYAEVRKKAIKEEANISNAWGSKKKAYYGAETADFDLMGEEVKTQRLQ